MDVDALKAALKYWKGQPGIPPGIVADLEAAVKMLLAERERCAKIAESSGKCEDCALGYNGCCSDSASWIAGLIRGSGEK